MLMNGQGDLFDNLVPKPRGEKTMKVAKNDLLTTAYLMSNGIFNALIENGILTEQQLNAATDEAFEVYQKQVKLNENSE